MHSYLPGARTRRQLVRTVISDLINESRQGSGAHQLQCRADAISLFRVRHTAQLNEDGWPLILLRPPWTLF
jgi:hypothetical protein